VRIRWLGTIAKSADELIASTEAFEDRTKVGDAKAFLRELLADNPTPADEVRRLAKEERISYATLRRAKESLE
jgi:hypothetical protein